MDIEARIAELKREAANAGVMAPSGLWALEGTQSWDRMLTLWEGPKGHDFVEQDLPLLMSWIPEPPLRVLEVGGGYGRLARRLIDMVGRDNISYTLVDAVPESLAYSERDMAGYPCKVVPVWRFEPEHYNLCINIASMQEMSQEQVDYYIALFDKVIEPEGIVFLMNSRDGWDSCRREYNYPRSWKLKHKGICHRSVTPDYPVEVFAKCCYALVGFNEPLENEYYRGLAQRYGDIYREVVQLRRILQDVRRENVQLKMHSRLLFKVAMAVRSRVRRLKK